MGTIIKRYERSVIVACDVRTISELENLVRQTCDVEGIGGYKVGSILAIRCGLPEVVRSIRNFTDMPVLYDHQKSMTDIPDLAEEFVSTVKDSGVDALIGFPLSGPLTLERWIEACKENDLEVIVGGEMTHPKYKKSEGGYLADEALDDIYLSAARFGINNFVVPGNKKERVLHYREILQFVQDLTFYAPGFVAQGGVITDIAKIAGPRWHAIIGRVIYSAKNIRAAAEEMTRQLT
jgi:orotidine-5'-phosphate decarboxylase